MTKSVISGDIVAYTSLGNEGREFLERSVAKLLPVLDERYEVFGRLIKGDYLECVVPLPGDALRVALLIKSYIKSLSSSPEISGTKDARYKFFKMHGIRLAIGYGELSRYDRARGIIDGDAIYQSGRLISELTSNRKERTVIKQTLYFVSGDPGLNESIGTLLSLLDVLLTRATAKQCEVLSNRLLDYSEREVASMLGVSQPVVNQHSGSLGWNAIERAVNYFSNVINQLRP
jgi:hypothetical protein